MFLCLTSRFTFTSCCSNGNRVLQGFTVMECLDFVLSYYWTYMLLKLSEDSTGCHPKYKLIPQTISGLVLIMILLWYFSFLFLMWNTKINLKIINCTSPSPLDRYPHYSGTVQSQFRRAVTYSWHLPAVVDESRFSYWSGCFPSEWGFPL